MSTSHRLLSAPIPPPQGGAPLPVPPLLEGIVDFAKLRRSGAIYVDKTAQLQRLARSEIIAYLSRPDGFGKSVLLSTLKYYFEGRADLFEGLAVGEAMASRAVAQRPVLHLNMEEMGSSIVKLEQNLTDWLITHEARYKIQVVPKTGSMRVRLKEIIERAFEESKIATEAQQGGTPSFPGVVVLIDNFHTPLVKSLGTPEERAVRELYDSLFYSLFQNSQVYFLLATGTLSLVHLRNHLRISAPPNDVSTRPEWSDVCGFSIEEIRDVCRPPRGDGGEAWGDNGGADVGVGAALQGIRVHLGKRLRDGVPPQRRTADAGRLRRVLDPACVLSSLYRVRLRRF
eukprot:gene11473-biopygen8328